MESLSQQYEAYPYPERDPADEKRRLITGSPSDPQELDHLLYGGKRDWSQPFRVLIAGGGTGDATIMLGQKLSDAKCPAEILHLDLSLASLRIAQDRAAARGLSHIRFEQGSLLDARSYGDFDYIDCCGVLHHLPDPQAGMMALAAALVPGGALGIMVYAPDGRAGIYPLQDAFTLLLPQDDPEQRLRIGKEVVAGLPDHHLFRDNRIVQDHKVSDAGFYDLLMHSQDRPFRVEEVVALFENAGLTFTAVPTPGLYDPARFLPKSDLIRERLATLSPLQALALGERLHGAMKRHIAYAVKEDAAPRAASAAPHLVPRLHGVGANALANEVKKRGKVVLSFETGSQEIVISPSLAPVIADLNGRRTLGAIADTRRTDWFQFAQTMAEIEAKLCPFGVLRYSKTFS